MTHLPHDAPPADGTAPPRTLSDRELLLHLAAVTGDLNAKVTRLLEEFGPVLDRVRRRYGAHESTGGRGWSRLL